jgi:hypothetical protein
VVDSALDWRGAFEGVFAAGLFQSEHDSLL